jgi:hypothetical protein
MSGYTCWIEYGKYKEVVGGDDDVDETNHSWMEQNMAREDTDVRDGDDVRDGNKGNRFFICLKNTISSGSM